MIFRNPAGAPELACDECGCRWFDRMTGACYECGVAVTAEAQAEFRRELEAFAALRAQANGVADRKAPCHSACNRQSSNQSPAHKNASR